MQQQAAERAEAAEGGSVQRETTCLHHQSIHAHDSLIMATAAYEENDDEGHYDRTQGMGAYSSAFLPEEHPIWRAQSVDHPYAGMKLVDISKMEIVRSFLFRNLPSSCKAFGLIQRLLRDAKESNAAVGNAGFVYVDDINDVNGVAVLHNADLKQKKKCNITCFVQF